MGTLILESFLSPHTVHSVSLLHIEREAAFQAACTVCGGLGVCYSLPDSISPLGQEREGASLSFLIAGFPGRNAYLNTPVPSPHAQCL